MVDNIEPKKWLEILKTFKRNFFKNYEKELEDYEDNKMSKLLNKLDKKN